MKDYETLDRNVLLEDYTASGNDFESLKEAIKNMNGITKFLRVPSREMNILSLKGVDDSRFCWYHIYTENFTDERRPVIPRLSNMGFAQMAGKGVTDELLKEIKDNAFMFEINGQCYPVSPKVFSTMDQLGMAGSFLDTPSYERDMMVGRQLSNIGRECTAVVREIGKVRKMFALLGPRYAHFDQMTLFDIIKRINADGVLGNSRCHHWEMSNFFTELYVEFPDKAKDIADEYKLPAPYVPGLLLQTSDTGNCSMTVKGTARIGNSLIILDEVRRKHSGAKGNADTDEVIKELLDDCETKIFSQFTKIPEKLIELMMLDIGPDDLSSAENRQKNGETIEGIIRSVFRQLGVLKILGNKNTKTLINQLVSEFDEENHYTGYDIAFAIMSIPERVTGIAKSHVKNLQKCLAQTPFCEFSDEELVLA